MGRSYVIACEPHRHVIRWPVSKSMADKPPQSKQSKVSVTAAPPQGGKADPAKPSAAAASSSSSVGDLSHSDIAPGRKVGKYAIHKVLGRGGMGVVYEATDVPLQRKVALKILPHEFSSDDQALQRFIREARMAARLNHPNAVAVYEIGRRGTVYFIAMELVGGASAQEMLVGGKKMAWRQATRAVIDACRGLSAAHAAGMIHRDIKPSNLLWTESGTVKVSDFGLAKPHNAENLSVTRRDQFVGTPLFMSPEQCRNDAVDNRSDIYSLGATYFMLLTGRAPFDQGSAIQILFAHCSAPIPDVTETDPDIPPMAAHVIRKAMAKRPEDRYQHIDEMLSDLETVLGTSVAEQASLVAAMEDADADILESIAAPLPPTPEPGFAVNWPWLIGGVVVLVTVLIGVVIALVMTRPSGEADPVAMATPQPMTVTPVPVLPAMPPVVEPEKTPAVAAQPTVPAVVVEPAKTSEPPVVAALPAAAPQVAAPTTLPAVASVVAVAPAMPSEVPAAQPAESSINPAPVEPERRGPGPNEGGPPPNEGGPLDGGGGRGDPVLREFARARIYAESALKGNDAAKKKLAGQVMILWSDFFADSVRPTHKNLAGVSKSMANKLSPGIESVQPRVEPMVDGVPLPPQWPADAERGPGAPGQDRPQPPPRERRPQRRQ